MGSFIMKETPCVVKVSSHHPCLLKLEMECLNSEEWSGQLGPLRVGAGVIEGGRVSVVGHVESSASYRGHVEIKSSYISALVCLGLFCVYCRPACQSVQRP